MNPPRVNTRKTYFVKEVTLIKQPLYGSPSTCREHAGNGGHQLFWPLALTFRETLKKTS
jgi:hypothetical protein